MNRAGLVAGTGVETQAPPLIALDERWGYVGLLGAGAGSSWLAADRAVLRFAVTVLAVLAGAWYWLYRDADRKARRLAARGDRSLPCATCRHYACDGGDCASCEGACTAPPVTLLPRPSVPRPRADWLN